MNVTFNSAADVCAHLNGLDNIEAKISNEMNYSDGIVGAMKIAFVSVSVNDRSSMWKVSVSQNAHIEVAIPMVGSSYPANTPEELTQALPALTKALTQ